jgi:hypothetical protein
MKAKVLIKGATGTLGSEKNYFDTYNSKPQSAFAHALVIGPSFIQNNGNSAWGIHTAYRNELSALHVPSAFAKYIYEKYNYEPFVTHRYNSPPFAVSWLNWGELGGTYGKVLMQGSDNYVKAAATVSFLAGFNGFYLDFRKFDYTVLDSASIVIHEMDAAIFHALSSDGSTGAGNFLKLRGFGFGTTLGVTYMHNRSRSGFDCNNRIADHVKKYDYRIGLSLLDFGYIHFYNQARMVPLNTTTDRLWGRLDTIKFHSFDHLDSLLSNQVNGIRDSRVNSSFNMYLPTAISLQFDYSFTPTIYGNLSWLNRINYSPAEIARGNQLDLSARYETKKFEATADLTLFEYTYPSVGVGFRFWYFVIGTDRFLELLSLTDIKSFNLFFGFKLNFCDFTGKKTKYYCPAFGK